MPKCGWIVIRNWFRRYNKKLDILKVNFQGLGGSAVHSRK